MGPNLKIISNGMPGGTKVFDRDGTQIKGIGKIEIAVLPGDHLVRAVLTFSHVELDMEVQDGTE